MAAESPIMDINGPTAGFDGELDFLAGPPTADFPIDQDFNLFDENPETNISFGSNDAGSESIGNSISDNASGDGVSKITASPTDIWRPTDGEFTAAAAASTTSTFLATPPLGHYSTPEDIAMSTQATPLFGNGNEDHLSGFTSNAGLDMFDSKYAPDAEDLNAWMAPKVDHSNGSSPHGSSVPMHRSGTAYSSQEPTTSGAKVLSPVYGGITKRRKPKPVKHLDPNEGKTSEDKKRMKNTLAARQSRARKLARTEQLEQAAIKLHSQARGLIALLQQHNLPIPPHLMVEEHLTIISGEDTTK